MPSTFHQQLSLPRETNSGRGPLVALVAELVIRRTVRAGLQQFKTGQRGRGTGARGNGDGIV